ncbi:MAG: DUF721 domain-containing protein [Caulobacteraceae bacterium]|nr:DUF721 domain-containing protein [Caulobacteraceae bacterium]
MPRRLPTPAEAAEILARRKTRPAHRPPPAAGRALNKTLRELDDRFGKGAGALTARWREIVGETLARRTEPTKLTKPKSGGGTLEIKVAGPVATLIQHQAQDILARVNLILGEGAVTRLRIVQGPLTVGLNADGAKPPRRRLPPLDAGAEARLADSLAAAPEGALKDALINLGRGVLRQGR